MAKYKKESLKGLLNLIIEICEDPENTWFKNELSDYLKEPFAGIDTFPLLIRYLKREYKKKGIKFYHDINDKLLKNELIQDFVEMYFNHSLNDMKKFLQYTFFQLENLLNYFCTKSNCFKKIENNRNYYAYAYSEKFSVNCYRNFFNVDKSEEINIYPKEIESVNIWSKITYWILETDNKVWFDKNRHNLSNIINVRNISSHRNALKQNQKDFDIVETLSKSDFSTIGFYLVILKEVAASLKKINAEVEIKESSPERTILRGPIVVGKIDLDAINKRKK